MEAPHRASALAPLLFGVVLGASLQLQQPALWPRATYVGGAGAALLLLVSAWCWRAAGVARAAAVLAAATALSFACTGWRAAAYLAEGLDPALEGEDLVVTGMVGAMPHRSDAGLRFRFEVEEARRAGTPVRLPPLLMLGWYGSDPGGEALPDPLRQPADLRAGERWRLALRLKAPHGQLNPHGFDYELWLWEQGVQATGAVRAG